MPAKPQTFPKTHRLGGRGTFKAIMDSGVKELRGPLLGFAVPNGLPHPRIGISVPKKLGNAARRNRVKRMLRESFRLLQHDLPRGYDLVVLVRPHAPAILADYQRLMSALMVKLHTSWQKRGPKPAPVARPAVHVTPKPPGEPPAAR